MDARLFRIDFPRVSIHDERFAVFILKCAKRQLRNSRRENSKVSAAGSGKVRAQKAKRRRGKLPKFLPVSACMRIGKPLSAGHTVKIVMDWVNAGIVCETLFGQNVQCP